MCWAIKIQGVLGIRDAKGEFFLSAFLQIAQRIPPLPVKAPHARVSQGVSSRRFTGPSRKNDCKIWVTWYNYTLYGVYDN